MRTEKEIVNKMAQIINREQMLMSSGNDVQLAETQGIAKALEWVLSFDEGGKK